MRRKSMNKKISAIIAASFIGGQLPISVLATSVTEDSIETSNEERIEDSVENSTEENSETNSEENSENNKSEEDDKDLEENLTNKDEDSEIYIQNYDRLEGITWTKLSGSGNTEVIDGFLSVTNNGDYRIVEDQSPNIKNGQLESRFIVGGSQTGIIFRANESNYGMINYNSGKGWVIENKSKWEDISGPTLNKGDEVIVKATFVDKKLTVNVSVNNGEFETIYDKESDLIPLQAGKVGYRGWGASKTTKFDYIKYSSISVENGPIVSINEVNVETYPRVKPNLPSSVTVNYENGMSSIKEVSWNYIPKENYSKPGTFKVEGIVEGTDIKAVANVTTKSDLSHYEINFDTEETRGDWQFTKGSGSPSYENGKLNLPMNGISTVVDMNSPDLKNFTYETDFSVDNDEGRIGLLFRYVSESEWAAICYDKNSWVWKTGDGKYGAFPGTFKIEKGKNYRIKLKVEDTNITMWIDDEKIGQTSVGNLPDVRGKIGLTGWYSNKNVTLDNIIVEELGEIIAPETGTLEEQSIESNFMKVVLDNRFPTVIRYEWKGTEDILLGAEVDDLQAQYMVEINGEKRIPKVTSEFNNNEGIYTLNFEDIGMIITLKITVNENKLRMEVTDIKEGDVKLQTLNFPNHSLASVSSLNNGKIASVLTTGDWNNIQEEFIDVAKERPGVKGKTYAFINDDKFAVTINNNTIEGGNRVVLTTENDVLPDNTNYKKVGISNGTWTYKEILQEATEQGSKLYQGEKPWSEVIIARDENEDGQIDWQDGAIQYRKNMKIPVGGDEIKNQMSYIDFNIGYTQNPFLRSLDTIKKLSNYTDGFGQLVLHKGYQAEGHDDSHPDYGGHIGIRQGGKEDFNTLIKQGKEYNAKIGVHVNATEYTMDAFQYPTKLVNEKHPGWGWLDQAYYVDQRGDITSGELFRRLDMLMEDAPDLGWIYVDVYTGNGWNAHQLGEKINDYGIMIATEMNGPLEQHVPWTHWGGDPAYPNKGNASKIMRFMKNDTQDSFLADSLVKGNKHLLSGGWGTRHDIEGDYGIGVFYNQVLPTKYLQHFPIIKMSENEVLFENGVKAVRENSNINYYRNDRLVATTPENSIGETGIGDTQLFLPWNPVDEANSDKIYHWNPLGTNSKWTLPEGWNSNKKVYLYELSDLGRTLVKEVKVINGKVNLDVKQNTPYIITKEKVEEKRISDWGDGSEIKDPGFDSQTFDKWNKESTAENTEHITIENENIEKRLGNDVLKISGNKGADAKISQNISGLKEGLTYSVSAWVKNDNNREVTLGVNLDGQDFTNVITSGGKVRQGEGVKYYGDTFVRMEVEFTVPKGVNSANIYLKASEGESDSVVLVDDFRIWDHPGHTNRDGYVFYEDFENVDEGISPFYLSPGRGTSNRTHLAEKDISINGNQRMNWVLDGRFSLKSNQQPNETGEMLTTDVSSFKLEPNKTYELGFLYSLENESPGYTVNIKTRNGDKILNIPLEATGSNYEQNIFTKTKSVTHEFSTGELDGDYYITLEKGEGFKEVILDNIYVKEIDKSVESAELAYVNLNVVKNHLEVGQRVPFSIEALMNNGEKVNLEEAEIEYEISNPDVLSIENKMMTGISDGVTDVKVNITLNGKKISSNIVKIVVGKVSSNEGSSSPSVINSIPEINAKDVELKIGDKFDPMEGVTAEDKEDGDITKNIEVIENNVDTEKAGDYNVVYKVTDSNGASSTKKINVKVNEKETTPLEEIKVTGIKLNKNNLNLKKGEKYTLKAEISPKDATNKEVIWISSNPNVVSVDENGNIEAKSVGEAEITVTIKDGGFKDTCKVIVTKSQSQSGVLPSTGSLIGRIAMSIIGAIVAGIGVAVVFYKKKDN
ncbi:endo-alpha-N-acetylgalactosaminidase family protein [Clostridium sp.]|uniref:endo-alpha-N-acetylgalactosaminidase family protein n=1 Tax=Clostridium sp. TaxID=1506 RepID=UPI0026151994|nr:endo-alpha-N-acetylgalactosaminidase family protein [Clostridium sp.]